jgi:hypothetical protein
MNKEECFSLKNVDNIRKHLSLSINDIMEKYSKLIIDYIEFIFQNIKIKNKEYRNFIITRGLNILTTVFCYLLYVTKNYELTIFHCQKSYYLYVEFIEQISNDQNIYLEISSRDAMFFIYKKTIYEINDEYRKNMEPCDLNNKKIFEMITLLVKIYNTLILYNIEIIDYKRLHDIYDQLNRLPYETHINIEILHSLENVLYTLDTYFTESTQFYDAFYELLIKINKNKNKNIICMIEKYICKKNIQL